MRRVPKSVIILVALLVIASAQAITWHQYARSALVLELPNMLHHGLVNAEQRMAPLAAWPQSAHVVLNGSIPESVAQDLPAFKTAFAPAHVKVATEREARDAGYLVGWRCRECTIVAYKEEWNNPLVARAAVSLGGGDHGAGYDHLYLHVLGHWVHLRTRFLWIT